MNEEKQGPVIRFTSKSEIATCISVLTPFTNPDDRMKEDYSFALEKIKELTKLL